MSKKRKREKIFQIIGCIVWIVILSYALFLDIPKFISEPDLFNFIYPIFLCFIAFIFNIVNLIGYVKAMLKQIDKLKKYDKKIHKLFKNAKAEDISITISDDTIIVYNEKTDTEITLNI